MESPMINVTPLDYRHAAWLIGVLRVAAELNPSEDVQKWTVNVLHRIRQAFPELTEEYALSEARREMLALRDADEESLETLEAGAHILDDIVFPQLRRR